MSSSDDSGEEEFGSRWKELQAGPMKCEKCHKKVTQMDQVVACGMALVYILEEDDYETKNKCPRLLCRACASYKPPIPFQPCQCFTLGDHEKMDWCPECTKTFRKCNACHGLLCQYCQVDDTKDYGLLCQHCCWAMCELLGSNPAGVSVCCSPWPRYKISADIQQAVQQLHDQKKQVIEVDDDDDDNGNEGGDKKPAAAPESSETTHQTVFVLLHSEGGPYRDTVAKVVGVYSTKELAIQSAKIKFEDLSHGCYQDGRFTQPEIFEEVFDNSMDAGRGDDVENATLLYQKDQEGEWTGLDLQKSPLDEAMSVSKQKAKRGTKRIRSLAMLRRENF